MRPVLVPLSGTERLALTWQDSRLEARLERKEAAVWVATAEVASVSLLTGHVAGSTTLQPHLDRLLALIFGAASHLSEAEQRALLSAYDELRRDRASNNAGFP